MNKSGHLKADAVRKGSVWFANIIELRVKELAPLCDSECNQFSEEELKICKRILEEQMVLPLHIKEGAVTLDDFRDEGMSES